MSRPLLVHPNFKKKSPEIAQSKRNAGNKRLRSPRSGIMQALLNTFQSPFSHRIMDNPVIVMCSRHKELVGLSFDRSDMDCLQEVYGPMHFLPNTILKGMIQAFCAHGHLRSAVEPEGQRPMYTLF